MRQHCEEPLWGTICKYMALHETAVLSFDSEVSTILCVQKRWGSELPVIVGIDSYARCSPPCIFWCSHMAVCFSPISMRLGSFLSNACLWKFSDQRKGTNQATLLAKLVGRKFSKVGLIDPARLISLFIILHHYVFSIEMHSAPYQAKSMLINKGSQLYCLTNNLASPFV